MTTTLIHMPYDDKDRHIKIRISELQNKLVTLSIIFNNNDVTFFGTIEDFIRLSESLQKELANKGAI